MRVLAIGAACLAGLLAGLGACSSPSPSMTDKGTTPPSDTAPAEFPNRGEGRGGEARPTDLKPPAPAHWETVPGSLALKDHTATLLADKRVLIAGGRTNTGTPPVTAKSTFFDPKSNAVQPGPSLKQARMGHTATLLSDGRVLVIGGYSESSVVIGSTEIFDPTKNAWTDGPALPTPRGGHSATLLKSGDVLIAGGYAYGKHISSLLLYKPSPGTPGSWSSVANVLGTARSAHAAVRLDNGKVIIIGGAGDAGSTTQILDSMEAYDPSSGAVSTLAKLTEPRNLPTANLLSSGKILVVGGNNAGHDDLYDPSLDKVTAISHLGDPPKRHAAATLNDGRVLVCGDDTAPGTRAEIFSSEGGGTWTATAPVKGARWGHTATKLDDGTVLVVGGFFPEWTFTTTVERFYP